MYNTQIIADKIKQLMKVRNVSQKVMLADLGMGINTISEFSKGKQMSCISFAKIADYLDCSIDYLMGRTDVVEVNKGDNTVISISELQSFIDKSTHTAQIAADTGKKQSPHPVDFDTLVEISKEEQNK